MNRYDEETLGALLRALPAAPDAWVRAAQELPAARRELADLVARATADAEFRHAVRADIDAILEESGLERTPAVVAALRAAVDRLDSP